MKNIGSISDHRRLAVIGFAYLLVLLSIPTVAQTDPNLTVSKVITTGHVHFTSSVTLEITGLDTALKTPGFDPGRLRLYLNGQQLTESRAVITDAAKNQLTFTLKRTPGDTAAWNSLVGSPPFSGIKQFTVGLGSRDGLEYPRTADSIDFYVFQGYWILLVAAFIAAIFAAAIVLAIKTDIVRDPVPPGRTLPPGKKRTYSLARCQIGFWLLLITSAFLFIWGCTLDPNGIVTADALMLLGISGTTALAAVGIDATKTLSPDPNWQGSEGFFKDILTDAGGYTWYRFQILVWTLILGAVFVIGVYQDFELPTFDAKLLAMIGVSGGLYVGFKFPEKQA